MRRAHQSKEIPWGIIKIWARKTLMKLFFLSSSSLGRNDISFLQFYSTSKDHPHFQQNHYICIFPRSLYFLKKSFLPQLKECGRWIMFKDRCTFLIKEERNMIKMMKEFFFKFLLLSWIEMKGVEVALKDNFVEFGYSFSMK